MKSEIVRSLTENFEGHAQRTEGGVEFWLARDLQHLLGYTEWRNFTAVILKAKTACEVSGHAIEDHFVEVTKMVGLGSGSRRAVDHVRKVERRLAAEEKKSLKNPDALDS